MKLYDEIARTAHELYMKSGCIPGRDLENWVEAENIVKARYEPVENAKSDPAVQAGEPARKKTAPAMAKDDPVVKKTASAVAKEASGTKKTAPAKKTTAKRTAKAKKTE